MLKILVAGGEGFIGSALIRRLQQFECSVTSIDSHETYGVMDTDYLSRLHEWRRAGWDRPVVTHRFDITDHTRLDEVMSDGFDIVVHLASYPRAKTVNQQPVVGVKNIVEGTVGLLEASAKHGVKRFVFASSSMIYGNFTSPAGEKATASPVNMYGQAKLSAEQFVKMWCNKNRMEHVIVRPSGVYGPGDIPDRVVTKFFDNAIAGLPITVHGNNRVDFTYIDNAVWGFAACALSDKAANNTFNISSGIGTRIYEVAQEIVRITDSNSDIVVEQDHSLYPARHGLDISKAKLILGYNPQTSITEGLQQYYDWIGTY